MLKGLLQTFSLGGLSQKNVKCSTKFITNHPELHVV